MTQAINPKIENIENTENIDEMRQHVVQLCQPLLDTMDCVLVTLGKHGLMVTVSILHSSFFSRKNHVYPCFFFLLCVRSFDEEIIARAFLLLRGIEIYRNQKLFLLATTQQLKLMK